MNDPLPWCQRFSGDWTLKGHTWKAGEYSIGSSPEPAPKIPACKREIKTLKTALTSVVRLVGHHPAKQKVAGLVPSRSVLSPSFSLLSPLSK